MAMREASKKRKTNETDINIKLNLDGNGNYKNETGVGFFDHMLDHLGKHGHFDLTVICKGDLHVDGHHTVEDVAICLGQVLDEALGDKKGIKRFASATVPMEDARADVSLDLCGRPFLVFNVAFTGPKVGEFDVELVEEFMRSFANNAKLNLHINVPYGTNNHHIAEAIFKATAQALAQAVAIDPNHENDVPSTKGTL